MRGTLSANMVSDLFSGNAVTIREPPFAHQRTIASNARTYVIEFDPKCCGKNHNHRSGADP